MESSDDLLERIAKGILAMVLLVASALALVFMVAISFIRMITHFAQNSNLDFQKKRSKPGVPKPFHHIPDTPRRFYTATQEAYQENEGGEGQ